MIPSSTSNKKNHYLDKHEIYHPFSAYEAVQWAKIRFKFNDQQGESRLL